MTGKSIIMPLLLLLSLATACSSTIQRHPHLEERIENVKNVVLEIDNYQAPHSTGNKDETNEK